VVIVRLAQRVLRFRFLDEGGHVQLEQEARRVERCLATCPPLLGNWN
jgi:hypothetical protein